MLPNFLIIGSKRCATTWIYKCLKEHPDVFVPPKRKEVQFFDRFYAKGLDWYRMWFQEWSNESAIGEASPSYLFHSEAPQRIAKHLSDVKLIVSVRNPVDRAWSQYWRNRSSGRITCDFQQAWREYPFLVEQGLYYKHIARYLDFFSRKNFLVLVFDDLRNDPISWIQSIFEFIDVDPGFVPSLVNRRSNKGQKHRFLWITDMVVGCKNFLRERELGSIVEIAKGIGFRKLIYSQNPLLKTGFPEMKPEVRETLIELFREENQKLSDWLGCDLSYWNEV